MKIPKLLPLVVAVAALFALATSVPLQGWLYEFSRWSQLHPQLAAAAFGGLVVLAMLLMFPVSIQAMTAGFIFGLGKGFAVMCVAGLAGFTAAFLVGRGLARPWIERRVARRPAYAAIDRAVKQNAVTIVLLARLSQVLPYNLLNYSLGLTSVSMRDYVIGSAVGMLPGIFMFVFLGTTATDLAQILDGDLDLGDYGFWVGVLGIVVLFAAATLIARVAGKALKVQLGDLN